MAARHTVIARFNEDVTWVRDLPRDWTHRIVQKCVDLPNHGREASSYCWWIWAHYGKIDPEGTYAFLQGHPFEPHGVRLYHLREVSRFEALGRDRIEERFSDGWIEGRGLDPVWRDAAVHAWQSWVSLSRPPPERHEFVIGAQFLVPGRVLLARPIAWWHDLGSWACFQHRPWILERLWQYILDPESYPPGS